MSGVRRIGLGAPNEELFGFVQVVANDVGPVAVGWVSGQVGKNNETGAMLPAGSFGQHAENALRNVDDAAALIGPDAATVALAAFVPGLGERSSVVELSSRLPAGVAATVVGIDQLSSPDYQIEIRAHVVRKSEEVFVNVIEWPDAPPRGAIGPAAVIADSVVHLSGHLAWDETGDLVDGDVGAHITACFAALDRTLARAGIDPLGLVEVTLFVVCAHAPLDFDAICAAHRSATEGRRPAATLIPVASLSHPGALACVSATASSMGLGE